MPQFGNQAKYYYDYSCIIKTNFLYFSKHHIKNYKQISLTLAPYFLTAVYDICGYYVNTCKLQFATCKII